MKALFTVKLLLFAWFSCYANGIYVGSTPAHREVRDFLQVSLTDSIDFIRWKLEISSGTFRLSAQYGISKPGTPGFMNEQRVSFEGQLTHAQHRYNLTNKGKNISLLEVNQNVLHFVGRNGLMLAGNGGYSYALNNVHPAETNAFNIRSQSTKNQSPLIFEGRTPCQELAALLGLEKSEACNKMKWYFLLYTDTVTQKPSYFLMNGTGYRKETMLRGTWEIVPGQNGRIVYRLYSDKWSRSLTLLKGDENILFFVNGKGQVLSGDEDFSYTLNRRGAEYPPVKR